MQIKYEPANEILVLIAYTSSKGSHQLVILGSQAKAIAAGTQNKDKDQDSGKYLDNL